MSPIDGGKEPWNLFEESVSVVNLGVFHSSGMLPDNSFEYKFIMVILAMSIVEGRGPVI
jgi:hypothetical protein